MGVNSQASALALDVCHDHVSTWVERELKSLHAVLRRRHRTNIIGRDILDRIIESCLEDV